jgi:hypothetical protein
LGSQLPPEVTPIEVVETEVKPPAPIVPPIDQLNLRSIEWVIITPSNAETVFSEMTGEKVLFALTAEGYENIALNLSDVRAILQQQQSIIAIYEKQFSD